MHRFLLLAVLLVVVLIQSDAAAEDAVFLGGSDAWEMAPLGNHQPQGAIIDDGPGYMLSVTAGYCQSVHIPVKPLHYYRLTFESKANGPGFWAAMFYNEQGEELKTDDHYSDVAASEDWIGNEVYFRGKFLAATTRLRFHPYHQGGKNLLLVRNVRLEEARHEQVLEWSARLYASLPPINYSPVDDRWQHIPRTMATLRDGGRLRVLFFGDSIANDTGSSPLELLIRRYYPDCEIEVICSVRSGTGCQYYQHENRVKDYVVRYEPDLVIIAGISHHFQAEPIHNVIRQIKEQCDAEIMLMSGAFVRVDMNRRNVMEFHEKLEQVTAEEEVEYLHIRRIWNEYVEHANAAGVEHAHFMRDTVHANENGRQIIARIIAAYFSPKR